MPEGVRPKIGFQQYATQEGVDSIRDGPIRSLTTAELCGCISRSRLDLISLVTEKIEDLLATPELTAEIEADILIKNVLAETMGGDPLIQEINRRCLAPETPAIDPTAEVVRDHAVTSLTMRSFETLVASGVLRVLSHKYKIPGNPLITNGSPTRIVPIASALVHLGLDAHRTLVQFAGEIELGDAASVLV
jgi:hypothetical protein